MADVAAGKIAELPKRVEAEGAAKAAAACGVGEPTLRDIVSELLKPGRDPRDELPLCCCAGTCSISAISSRAWSSWGRSETS